MRIVAVLLFLILCAGASAQLHHDPLSSLEVDQMRDTAQDPERRTALLLGFAHERLLGVERLHVDGKSAGSDLAKAEELLGDFALLIDELDDNLDAYDRRGEDIRTSLHHVLDAEGSLQQELKGLADQIARLQAQGPTVGLRAALADATDSLQSSSENAGAMLAAADRKRGQGRSEKKPVPHE